MLTRGGSGRADGNPPDRCPLHFRLGFRSCIVSHMRRLLLFALLSVLAACESPEQVRRQHFSACANYGYRPGEPGWAECMERQDMRRQQRISAGLASLSASARDAAATMPRPVTCYSAGFGLVTCQ